MCGIFGYTGENNKAHELVLEGLKSLEYRGYDSWGIASVGKSGVLSIEKQTGKIGSKKFNESQISNTAIGHTRWATHGGVTVRNAHPHLDCSKRLALIHNGIVENYSELKDMLVELGHKFASETDSEVIVHLIEEKLKSTGFEDAVMLSFKMLKGMNAVIVLDAVQKRFAAAKNGSPLVIAKGEHENFLASDAHAVLPFTKKVYFMEDMEMVILDNKEIKAVNLQTGKEKGISFTVLDWNVEKENIGNFKHFMLKEIFDQEKIIEYIRSHQSDKSGKFARLISGSYGTYLVGCGTAAYACLAGTYIFSKIAKFHLNFSVASEFGYLIDFLTPKSLVIGLSQSGETIDLIDALKKAKDKRAKIAAMVNVMGSTLYRISDEKLLLNAGFEKAVVSTKAFTAKIAHLILVAYELAGKGSEGSKIVGMAVDAVRNVLKEQNLEKIRKLAIKLGKAGHIYVIGRGVSYPAALETALKIKEASYIHAEGFAGGELKHGVIALIAKNTPCIAFIPEDETYQDTLSGVMEMKARGGYMIGIGVRKHEVFDEFLTIKDCGIASIIPGVVIGQLLGYYLAVNKGLDPDKPRNLAKSVTVK